MFILKYHHKIQDYKKPSLTWIFTADSFATSFVFTKMGKFQKCEIHNDNDLACHQQYTRMHWNLFLKEYKLIHSVLDTSVFHTTICISNY